MITVIITGPQDTGKTTLIRKKFPDANQCVNFQGWEKEIDVNKDTLVFDGVSAQEITYLSKLVEKIKVRKPYSNNIIFYKPKMVIFITNERVIIS